MDDVHLEDHVVVHEIGQGRLVGNNAAYLGSSEEHVLGLLLGEEGLNGILAGEVELRMRSQHQVVITLTL